MLTQELRRAFLNYFKNKNHAVIPSSPVVPHDDPTLLFTNAGMNQFKDVFLGESVRDYKRAATSQKCIRVGGKHNDLENVGHTSRHLTFFEMLGNFSFGDYFKKEAIQFAWEVATEVFKFEPERIWPTVFREDDEAFELWKAYVDEKKIVRFDEKDNFWAMGETGPCGPCSELLYDRGIQFGSIDHPKNDLSGERFLEFWNLVFMQYNRSIDGKMVALPKPSIDTGAGLERVMSLKMGVDSVFETDILRSLIAQIEQISKQTYQPDNHEKAPAFRVIADHLRTLAFAIADGVQPSNLDRGYVLRKVLRRAVRYGRQLGFEKPFLAEVFPRLIETMGKDYPELVQSKARISEILTVEEEAFFKTLKRGGNLLNQIIASSQSKGMISGDDAFKLKDTYGLPFEEISLIAKDSELAIDQPRFEILEKEAKERSKSAHKTTHQIIKETIFEDFAKAKGNTEFLGYETTTIPVKVIGIIKDQAFVDQIESGDEALIILDKTPFYAEMGGQIGDTGVLENREVEFEVSDTKAPYKGLIAHVGKLKRGTLKVGMGINASVNSTRRQLIANNHTATHLLHYALQKVLGEHVKQAGSVVDEKRLRFDFSHHKSLTLNEIRSIEQFVNNQIRENHPVKTYQLAFDEVKERGDIKQFFGEKYGSQVRVVETGDSKELCGGTHTAMSGDIGYFRIENESSIAAGVRRIQAVTGAAAEALAIQAEEQLSKLATLLKTNSTQLNERIEKLLEENRSYTEVLKKKRNEEISKLKKELQKQRETIRDVTLFAAELPLSIEEMREVAEELSSQAPLTLVLLASGQSDKAQLYLKVSPGLVQKGLNAAAIIRELAGLIDGSGGGKADSATAGGKAIDKIPLALIKIRDYIP